MAHRQPTHGEWAVHRALARALERALDRELVQLFYGAGDGSAIVVSRAVLLRVWPPASPPATARVELHLFPAALVAHYHVLDAQRLGAVVRDTLDAAAGHALPVELAF